MSAFLAPGPFGAGFQAFTNQGVVLAGGLLYTYLAGGTTPAATYTDSTQNTPNANPVVLDSAGRSSTEVWLTSGVSYKFILKDSSGNTIGTWDNLSGVNDTAVSASQWVATGLTPTYVGANQFSVQGDQTSTFTVGRRVQAAVSAGTIYGSVTASVFAASVTTVTVLWDSVALDNGLSSVNVALLTAVNPSIPSTYALLASPAFSGTPIAPTPSIGDNSTKIATTAFVNSEINLVSSPGIRQTVLSGPIDSSGFPAYGGSTGATTVTTTAISASSPLIVQAAGGYVGDRVGNSTTNLSWTGLSSNGTMYLYIDVSATGVLTTGSTTLQPTYAFGGAPSSTNNQASFIIQQMQMFYGNGTSASQVYRVFVGEVTVAGGVVTAIIWYAIMGRYVSTGNAYAASTQYSKSHNIGVTPNPGNVILYFRCTTTDIGYAVGDVVPVGSVYDVSGVASLNPWVNRLSVGIAQTNSIRFSNKSTGAVAGITVANWVVDYDVRRGW